MNTIRLNTIGDSPVVVKKGSQVQSQEKTVEITENGTTEVVPDSGFSLSKVTINTNVESSISENDVNFYDYDGVLLHSYSWDEAVAMTELPPLPEREGLICQEWNYTLDDIKAQEAHKCNIGATYTTDDGATRLYIDLLKTEKKVSFWIKKVGEALTIDWGDGSVDTDIEGLVQHSYSPSYTNSIISIYGDFKFGYDKNNPNLSGFDKNTGTSRPIKIEPIKYMLRKIVFAPNCKATTLSSSYGIYNMEDIPNLNFVSVPKEFVNNGATIPYKLINLSSYFIYPRGVTDGSMYYNSKTIVPNTVTSISLDNTHATWEKDLVIPASCLTMSSLSYSDSYQWYIPRIYINSANLSKFTAGVYNELKELHCVKMPIIKVDEYCDLFIRDIDSIFQNTGYCKINNLYNLEGVLITDIIIPESATKVYLRGATSIKSIIDNSAIELVESSFEELKNLETIQLHDGITTIPNYCFRNCWALTELTLPNTITEVKYSSFEGLYSLKKFKYPSGVAIITGLSDCVSLTDVEIPEGAEEVSGFGNCSSLTKITLPSTIKKVNGFSYCTLLSEINIPEGVTSVGGFEDCVSLEKIQFPSTVTELKSQSFYRCSKLKVIDFSQASTIPTLGRYSFNSGMTNKTIIVPDTLYDEWIVATNWTGLASNIVKASEYTETQEA